MVAGGTVEVEVVAKPEVSEVVELMRAQAEAYRAVARTLESHALALESTGNVRTTLDMAGEVHVSGR